MPTYAINTKTTGLSTYTGWTPVAVIDYGNALYVMQADGLFAHTGTTDDGTEIAAYIKTGQLMAGAISAEKQVHHVWLTLAGTDDVDVTLYPAYWDGEETLGPYVAEALSTTQPHNRVVRGLLGEAGQWWSVKVANKDGGALDIRSLHLLLDQTKTLM